MESAVTLDIIVHNYLFVKFFMMWKLRDLRDIERDILLIDLDCRKQAPQDSNKR